MKKLITITLSLAMILSLTAYGANENEEISAEDETVNSALEFAAAAQTENGTFDQASDLNSGINYSDISSVSFTLADAVTYRTKGADKAIPGFDTIDYGQEDYIFGSSEQDARHWNSYLLKIFKEYADVPEPLFTVATNADTPDNDRTNRHDMEDNDMKNHFNVGSKGNRKAVVETAPDITAVISEGAAKFTQFTFEDEETGITLEYSLYIPENYDESQEYPILMYIPDASGASKSAKELVEQYYGADIWVTNEVQEKHPSFVLVPAFSEIVVDDDWNTSKQIEAAVRLINHLTEYYSIDTNRLYTTGQSMGCMTSLYLNSKYPDLFAASLFVSGQWDISVLQPLEDAKFFYITAGGDTKASGGQDEVKAMFDTDGTGYSYGTWNAQDSAEKQNAAAEALIAQGYDANMIRFETGSVLNGASGMEHNASFVYGYRISAVRDWLFAQSK